MLGEVIPELHAGEGSEANEIIDTLLPLGLDIERRGPRVEKIEIQSSTLPRRCPLCADTQRHTHTHTHTQTHIIAKMTP